MAEGPLSQEDDDDSVDEGWLATFADISMLLLTFFILLLSMSTIDKNKFTESFSNIQDTFGGNAMKHIAPHNPQDAAAKDAAARDAASEAALRKQMLEEQRKTFNELRAAIAQASLDRSISANLDEGIITLHLPAEALFDKGSEIVRPDGQIVLQFLRDLFMKNREQQIAIKGYTDDSPLTNASRFRDNWELSALRSVNVLRTFLSKGIEATRMTATGLGDLNPLAPNTTEENRARNRRVEFVLERRIAK